MTAWPRTIQGRLTLAYAIAFAVGLVIFAAISFGSLDTALNAVLDERLKLVRTSIAEILAENPEVGPAARERIDLVVGSNRNAAVFTASGKAVYESPVKVSPSVRATILQATDTPHLMTLHTRNIPQRLITQRIRTPNGRSFALGISRPLDLVLGIERLATLLLGAAVIVIGLSALLVGSIVARQGLKPLRAVAELASEIEAHDLSRRLGKQSDSSELGQLATTFDRMLERLENAFERQRRFTADASHELRAPLSVVRIAADLALRRERSPAAYRRVLSSILTATQQLEELTGRLLLAARADAGHVHIERVDLSELAAEALAQLTPLAESKHIVSVPSLEPQAFVKADRSGLVRAIIALLDNAIAYSPAGGSVFVSTLRENGSVRLTLEDEGPGFSAEGLLHATDRFWRKDAARATGTGSGLGLAITDSIVRASGGSLALQNAADGGARVVVEFAAATV